MYQYRAPRATLADVVNRLLIRFTTLHHRNVRTIPFEVFERGRSLMLWIANRAGTDAYDSILCSHELYRLTNDLPFINYLETLTSLEQVMQRVDEEAGRYRPRTQRQDAAARMHSYGRAPSQSGYLREPIPA